MENNASKKWYRVKSVPESHTFGVEDRPGKEEIPLCDTIPIINLANPHTAEIVGKIIQASKEYGFFQVINHGVGEDVTREALKVWEELFAKETEEISNDAKANGWVYMGSTTFTTNGAHLWRDNLKHPCHPLEECMQHWPQSPTRYREVVARYIKGIRSTSLRILDRICEGLGLEKGYLGGMSRVQFLTASNYPTCPDPNLTLGLLPHLDHSLITILFQGNGEGLQVMVNGKWMGVEVVPNAFLVLVGTQIEIISNGMIRSPWHRVVTNREEGRTSIATFINPGPDCIIGPANIFVNGSNPPLYPSLSFHEFVKSSKAFGPFTDVFQNIGPSKIHG